MFNNFSPFFNPQMPNQLPFQALLQLLQSGFTTNQNPFGLSPQGFPIVTNAPMSNPFGLTPSNPNPNAFDPLNGGIINYAPTNQNNGQNPYAGLSNPVDDIVNMLNPKQQFFQQFGIDYNPFNTAQQRPGDQMRQIFNSQRPNNVNLSSFTDPRLSQGNMNIYQPVKEPQIADTRKNMLGQQPYRF